MDSQDSELDCDPGFMTGRERKFSLYSTDTEERIISLDKGLDKCAGVLKSLLNTKKVSTMLGAEGKIMAKKPSAWRKGKITERPRAAAGKKDGNQVSHPAACSTPDRKAAGGGGRLAVHGGGNLTGERRVPSTLAAAVRAKAGNHGHLLPRAVTEEGQEDRVKGFPALPTVSKIKPQRIGTWTSSRGTKEQTVPGVPPNCPHCRCKVRNQAQDNGGSEPAPSPLLPPCYHHHTPYGFPWLPPPYPPYPYFSHHHPLHSNGDDHTPTLQCGPPGSSRRTGERNRLRNKSDLRNMDALDLASVHYWPPPPRMLPMDYYYWYLGSQGLQPPCSQPASDYQRNSGSAIGAEPQHSSAPASTNKRNHTENCRAIPLVAKPSAAEAAADSQHQSHSTDLESVSTAVMNCKLSQPASINTTDGRQLPKKSLPAEASLGQAPPVKSSSQIGTSRSGVMSARAVPAPRLEKVSDMQGLQALLADLMTCCEENIRNIRANTNGVMGTQLAHLVEVLGQIKSHLVEQCHGVAVKARQDRTNEKSVTDWLAQTQQLEEEKTGLIERLKESCTAYSELRKKLDEVEEEKQEQRKKLKEARKEVSSVRVELDSMSVNMNQVSANLRLKEMELAHVQSSSLPFQDLKTKNLSLEKRIAGLDGELEQRKEELKRLRTELKRVRRALSERKEEEHMLRLSVESKSSQLLEIQDKLLGMRQCLACFLSSLTRVTAGTQDSGTAGASPMFLVTAEELEKLKLLAEDGNIENYLSSYNKRENLTVTFPDLKRHHHKAALTTKLGHQIEKRRAGEDWGALSTCSTSISSCNDIPTPLGSSANSSHDGSSTPTPQPNHFMPSTKLDRRHHPVLLSPRHRTSTTNGQSRGDTSSLSGSSPYQKKQANSLVLSFSPSSSAAGEDLDIGHNRLGRVQVPSLTDVRSSMTTASELDFRKELASLDADIARLQVQFRVALQPSQEA